MRIVNSTFEFDFFDFVRICFFKHCLTLDKTPLSNTLFVPKISIFVLFYITYV